MSESSWINPGDFVDALTDVQSALADSAPADSASPEQPDNAEQDDELYGEGEAANGNVRVFVTTAGRVSTVRLEKKALELPVEDLQAAVVAATNAAREQMMTINSQSSGDAPNNWNPRQLMTMQRESALQLRKLAMRLGSMMDDIARAADTPTRR